MKFTPALKSATLIKRYKRFLADCQLDDGSLMTLHCPNTGSMKNCAEPGSKIWYSLSDNPKRKYPGTFEMIEVAGSSLVGVNTGRANQLVAEALSNESIPEISGFRSIRREVSYGCENSRIDFLLEDNEATPEQKCFIEVKSVTLGVGEGLGMFPDAVTKRGARHLRELIQVVSEGHRAILLFCVQHSGIERVEPADSIDPEYGSILRKAKEAGVEVLAYRAEISEKEISLSRRIPVIFPLQ